jgi:hypothetical protein
MSTMEDRVNAPKVPVVPAEPSLAGFVKWLETKDPTETYEYAYSQSCAVGKYFEALGMDPWEIGRPGMGLTPFQRAWQGIGWGNLNSLAGQNPRTYGALSARAKAQLGR